MIGENYAKGMEAALEACGISKEAAFGPVGAFAGKAFNAVKNFAPNAKKYLNSVKIGQPKTTSDYMKHHIKRGGRMFANNPVKTAVGAGALGVYAASPGSAPAQQSPYMKDNYYPYQN